MNIRLPVLIAAACFGLDRFSKWYIVEYLDLRTLGAMDVVPPFINFRMAWNTGINFGLLASDGVSIRIILAALALIISIGLLIWCARYTDRWLALGCGLVIGGAIGNAYDRLVYGAVADFLNMSCCGISNPFAFNVADIAIFAGMVLLLLRPTPK